MRWKIRRNKRIPGEVINSFHNPVTFDPKLLRATMAWSGRRVAITLCTVRAHDQLSGSDVGRLQDVGFPGLSAVHYLESTCQPSQPLEVERATECEHDYEAVFEGHGASSPMPSMLKQMLSRAAPGFPNSVPSPHETHIMSSLAARVNRMVEEENQEDKNVKTPSMSAKKREAAWRRMVPHLMWMLATARRQMVSDYLLMRNGPKEEPATSTQPTSNRRKKSPNRPIAQGIGEPLPRSASRKTWQSEPKDCPHGPDHLRCRANRKASWWTCLKCGSRWRRTWEGKDDAEIPANTTEDAKNMIDRRGRAYPKFLPAPQGRPEQGPREVEINSQGKATVITRRAEANAETSERGSRALDKLLLSRESFLPARARFDGQRRRLGKGPRRRCARSSWTTRPSTR